MNRSQYFEIRKKLDLAHDNWALPIHVLQNILIVAMISYGWIQLNSPLGKLILIPLTSILIFRNFSMMHESVHRAATRNFQINEYIGIFSGAVCLLPYEPWKKSHLEHHTWSGNIEKDPVTKIVSAFPQMSARAQKTYSALWMVWFPVLACMQYVVFWWLASKTYSKNPKSKKILVSLAAPPALWTIAFVACPLAFSLQVLLPAVFLYLIAVEVVNFPHHLQLPQYRGDTKLPIWEQYKIARTCLYPRWFARLVALNFNFHTEHHMFPEVPWYHLEKLHTEVSQALGSNYNSDPYFQWILENKVLPIHEVLKARDDEAA